MNHSMINASVTMNGLMRKLDVISNNMANMNTDGFKKQEASFEDLLTTIKGQHPKQQLPGRLTPPGITIGSGARLSQIQINMAQGTLRTTDNPYDLAIEGDALFEVGLRSVDEEGNETLRPAWTRNGSFRVSLIAGDPDNNMLTTSDGSPVFGADGEPMVVPSGRRILVDDRGIVYAYMADDPNTPPEVVGSLKLVRASRPQLLQTQGDNLFVLPPQFSAPAQLEQMMQQLDLTVYEDGASPVRIRQGYLEGSNVDLPSEMTELIEVQRAFQLNARALSSSETMMNLTNNLRG